MSNILFVFDNDKGNRGGLRIIDATYEGIDCVGKSKIIYSLKTRYSVLNFALFLGYGVLSYARRNRISRVDILYLHSSNLIDLALALLLKMITFNSIRVIVPFYHLAKEAAEFKVSKSIVSYWERDKLRLLFMPLIADIALTENSYIKIYLERIGVNKVVVSTPGVKTSLLDLDIESMTGRLRDIDLLFVGALCKEKGIFDFVEVIKALKTKGIRLKAAICGYRQTDADWELLISRSSEISDLLEIYPDADESAKVELLQRARVVVFPSYLEGVPIVFWEAMSQGCLIITYRLNSYVDVESNIISCELGSVQSLTDTVLVVLSDYKSYVNRYVYHNRRDASLNTFEGEISKIANLLCSMAG